MDPKEELAGDIGAAFAGGANVGTAIKVTKARAAISVFMIRLHIWTICPRFAHRRMTDRPAPAGGIWLHPCRRAVMPITVFAMIQNDSGKRETG